MNIFISKINESWIVDRLKDEWSQFNAETVVNNIKKTSKKSPIRKNPSWVLCFNGLPKIFSNA